MTNAHRDLATPELWTRSLERSRRRRELLPKARRENSRRKHISAALATAVVAGPGAPLAAAQVAGDVSAAVAAESPANRAIEIREGGLPLRVGSHGELVAHVQKRLGVASDGIFGPQTDAAVRRYQLSAGLEVDGIVGPSTWSSLFEKAGASGAAMGGSNIPPQVKQEVEQRLERAGQRLAAQGNAGAGIGVGGQVDSTTPTAPTTQGDSTLPTTQAPAGGSCGSSTISTPVNGTVTSNFGPRWGRNHDGIDIAAPTGTAVRAAACGTVSLAGQQSGYGNMVCITHTSQFSTCYAHLSRFAVSNGASVQQGQVIGYVGCTGNCTGPHLHFETRVNGQAQDPRTYLSGGAIPGGQATVAGASSSSTGTSSTATREATVTESGSSSTTATAPESVAPTEGGAELAVPIPATSTTATVTETPAASTPEVSAQPVGGEAVPAEVAVEPVAVEAAPTEATTEPVAVEAAPAEVAAEPVAVEAAPAEVAAEPVAVEAAPAEVAAEPVAVEAAPAEVAAEPVAVVAAPAEVAAQATATTDAAASVAPASEAAAAAGAAADQAQVGAAATAATG
jgi:Meckel syndrome type 1 protein